MTGRFLSPFNDEELEPIRKDLLQLSLYTACILGGAALGAYAWIAYRMNNLADLIPHTLAYLLIVFVTINVRLSYRLRVSIAMLCVYVLSITEFINNGLNGDGRILMLTFVALTSYFSGFRWGFIAFLISLATQMFLGFIIPLTWNDRPDLSNLDVNTQVVAWQISTLMFLILAAVMVGGGYLIISRLAHSLTRQRTLAQELNLEKDSLQVRVDEQTADLRREISERIRVGDELRASESQFRMLFEASMVPIFLLRLDKFELVNTAYLKLIGARDANEIIGRSYLEFTALEERENIGQTSQAFVAGEKLPEIYETVGARLDGSTFPCEISVNQLQLPGEPATLVYLMDITDRKLSAERLMYLSTHDPLTNLYNRVYFEQILDTETNHTTPPVSILALDVNGLKMVNDTQGHAAGDMLLKDTAKVLMRAMRGEDIVARIGGDEFVVVMPGTDQPAAEKVISRIEAAILMHNGSHAHDEPISIAIGCATVEPGETLVNAVKRADEDMYIHKRENAPEAGLVLPAQV